MKIKAKNLRLDPVRTAAEKAKLQFIDDDGSMQTAETRVCYRSPTAQGFRNHDSILHKKGDEATFAEMVFDYLESLPDVVEEVEGENGAVLEVPVKITLEFVENMHSKNLQEIYRVIKDDLNPKSPPASSPIISEPTAKKGKGSKG